MGHVEQLYKHSRVVFVRDIRARKQRQIFWPPCLKERRVPSIQVGSRRPQLQLVVERTNRDVIVPRSPAKQNDARRGACHPETSRYRKPALQSQTHLRISARLKPRDTRGSEAL